MNRRAAGVVLVALAVLAPGIFVAGAEPADPRVVELLRLECATELGRRELTLFANGTVRLREGPAGEEELKLGELAPDELAAYRERLRAEDLSEVAPDRSGPSGDWIEACSLTLSPDGEEPAPVFRFGRFDRLPLALSRVLAVAEDLAAEVSAVAEEDRLPDGYRPRRGDVLRRADGALFEVVGPTADRRGVELRGVDMPLTVYIVTTDLQREFVALVSRRPLR